MQLDLVNADCKYNDAFSLGSVCLYVPSLSQRYNILTDMPKNQ